MMPSIEHSILPLGPRTRAQRPRGFPGFELVAVVRVLDEELHVVIGMHVDDDRSIVHDVVVQILQIAGSVPKSLNSCQ